MAAGLRSGRGSLLLALRRAAARAAAAPLHHLRPGRAGGAVVAEAVRRATAGALAVRGLAIGPPGHVLRSEDGYQAAHVRRGAEGEARQADEHGGRAVGDEPQAEALEARAGPEEVPLVAQVLPHDPVIVAHLLLVDTQNLGEEHHHAVRQELHHDDGGAQQERHRRGGPERHARLAGEHRLRREVEAGRGREAVDHHVQVVAQPRLLVQRARRVAVDGVQEVAAGVVGREAVAAALDGQVQQHDARVVDDVGDVEKLLQLHRDPRGRAGAEAGGPAGAVA
mmetsp:Transcript_120236/g.373720  ORF Transcript_120236/g.373720 Transcript_120236/m.373720 type:complete len:281 (+) Transcript_120236:201-1043(+)